MGILTKQKMQDETRNQEAAAAWRKHTVHLAVPTILLALLVIVGECVVWFAVISKHLPLWGGSLVCVVLAFWAFTPMHEAAHGNLHGRRMKLRWLNGIVGRAMAVALIATYSGFKILHLRHHAKTNDEEDDPDYWVAVDGTAHIMWRCLTTFFRYYQIALFPPSGHSRRRRLLRKSSCLAIVSYGILSGVVVLSGYGMELLGLWILPGLAAISLLSFAFNWLPHAPHNHRDPYRNARIMLGQGLTALLVGQNYHTIHHLLPRVPFYRYGAVFREMRHELEEAGTEILGTR